MQAYIDVFAAAAVLQKLLLAALLLAAVITVAVTIRRLASPASAAPSFIVPLQIAAPALGLATAGLEAEHMMGTVLRLPGEPVRGTATRSGRRGGGPQPQIAR